MRALVSFGIQAQSIKEKKSCERRVNKCCWTWPSLGEQRKCCLQLGWGFVDKIEEDRPASVRVVELSG